MRDIAIVLYFLFESSTIANISNNGITTCQSDAILLLLPPSVEFLYNLGCRRRLGGYLCTLMETLAYYCSCRKSCESLINCGMGSLCSNNIVLCEYMNCVDSRWVVELDGAPEVFKGISFLRRLCVFCNPYNQSDNSHERGGVMGMGPTWLWLPSSFSVYLSQFMWMVTLVGALVACAWTLISHCKYHQKLSDAEYLLIMFEVNSMYIIARGPSGKRCAMRHHCNNTIRSLRVAMMTKTQALNDLDITYVWHCLSHALLCTQMYKFCDLGIF